MKYVAVAKAPIGYFRDDFEGSVTADQVIENDDSDRRNTGLVNAQSIPLYRVRDRIPFGFVSRKS